MLMPSREHKIESEKRVGVTLSLSNLMNRYPDKQSVIDHLERFRWGNKPHCTKCGCNSKLRPQDKHPGRWWCGNCSSYFTVRTGTPLEDAKVDPRKWLFAAYLLMTARKGISAIQFSKEASVSYPAEWYMLHRLRLGCGEKMETLRGTLEADETYLGGKEGNKHSNRKLDVGGGTGGKPPVFGVRERGGRMVAKPVEPTESASLPRTGWTPCSGAWWASSSPTGS